MKGAPHNYAAICADPSQRTEIGTAEERGLKSNGTERE